METLVKMIPKIFEILAILAIIAVLYLLFFPKEKPSLMSQNLKIIAEEMKDLKDNEQIEAPLLKSTVKYVAYPKAPSDAKGCIKDKGCLCATSENSEKCRALEFTVQLSCLEADKDTSSIALKRENGAVRIVGKC